MIEVTPVPGLTWTRAQNTERERERERERRQIAIKWFADRLTEVKHSNSSLSSTLGTPRCIKAARLDDVYVAV